MEGDRSKRRAGSDSSGQLFLCLQTHLFHIHIFNDCVPFVNLGLNLAQVAAYPTGSPFVAIADPSTTLHKPLRSLSSDGIKNGKDGLEVLIALYPFIREQLRKNSAVFKAEACSRPMVWGGRMRSIAR